jgi:hypothetical protein
VDFDYFNAVVTAPEGQEALVSTLPPLAVPTQKLLIDAAVNAGVKRIIPSEFGCNLHYDKARTLPVYAAKVEIENYLDELAVKGLVSYTLVFTEPFLDWGLRNGAFFNFKERKAELYDGGDQLFSTSRLSTAGKAVRSILTNPLETADRAVWVKDADVSQKQLLKLAQSKTTGEEWVVKEVDTAELEKQGVGSGQLGVRPAALQPSLQARHAKFRPDKRPFGNFFNGSTPWKSLHYAF